MYKTDVFFRSAHLAQHLLNFGGYARIWLLHYNFSNWVLIYTYYNQNPLTSHHPMNFLMTSTLFFFQVKLEYSRPLFRSETTLQDFLLSLESMKKEGFGTRVVNLDLDTRVLVPIFIYIYLSLSKIHNTLLFVCIMSCCV